MADSRLISSEPFPGVTADHIRALMQRFVAHHPRGWESTNGELLIGFGELEQTIATRGSWVVALHPGSSSGTECWAGVEAYEQPGYTKVDFGDGYFPGAPPGVEYPPIGAAFEEFCEMIVREMQLLVSTREEAGNKYGPTIKIQERARVCKELKDAHPEWTQEKLAMEAGDRLGEILSAESVRNVYRAMGWKWKRGERTR